MILYMRGGGGQITYMGLILSNSEVNTPLIIGC